MFTINDIKVELLNKEEVKNFIKNHGIFACQCYMTPEKYAERVGLSCLKEGHTSGSRADMFKFRIHCPRFCADQIMRHSVGQLSIANHKDMLIWMKILVYTFHHKL